MKSIAHGFSKRRATEAKTMGNVFQNHGQHFRKVWAMFLETMSNTFCGYKPYIFQKG